MRCFRLPLWRRKGLLASSRKSRSRGRPASSCRASRLVLPTMPHFAVGGRVSSDSAPAVGREYLMRMNSEIDIRGVLPAIHVPTLIMHRAGDARVNVAAGRYLAQHIDGARYVELPGNDHLFCAGQSQRIVDEIEEFLTGSRSHSE